MNQKTKTSADSSSDTMEDSKVKKIALKNQKINSSIAKMQPEPSAKDYLIEKLDYLNTVLPKNHRARQPLNLRLAHILSLRAEENFIKAERENCKPCEKTAKSHAIRSLSLYQKTDSLLSARHPLLHTEALFNQAYMHRFLGEKSKSLSVLRRITVKRGIALLFMARAWFNIGEIHFELYDYEKSLQAFNRVLKLGQSPWRFKAFYRKIWSLSNLSLYEQSVNELESFLQSKLYSDPDLNEENQKLKQKLESELIVLYQYAQVTDQRLAFLYNFLRQNQSKNTIPEKNKRLFNLAQTLSRIGKMKDSNKVWHQYISKITNWGNRLQAYFFMVDNELNLDQWNWLKITGQKMERIFAIQKKIKISKDFKDQLSQQAKRFFNKVSKKQKIFFNDQKNYLLTLYQTYSSIHPGDVSVLSQSAGLAIDLKKYALAQDIFQTAVLNIDSYKNEKISKTDIKEKMSIGQMEMAELTKDEKRQLNSYNFYIQHGSSEELIFKAKYQKAYISYENKNYKKSADLFKNLALYKAKQKNLENLQTLRLKAAHLSLSALDQLGHQEEKLAHRAGLFMQKFPQNRKEFIRIYHAALLNTVKKLVSDKDFSHRPVRASQDKNILKAWEVLQLVSVKDAVPTEVLTYHFNKLLLAKELLKFKPMDQSVKALLSNKNLGKEDKRIVLTWKLWLSELRFDFKEVLRILQILRPEDQSEEHLLHLSLLAELSGQSPIFYYKNFIDRFPNSQSTVAVLTSAIEKSSDRNKRLFLKKYSPLFKNQPNVLTYLILKTDGGKLEIDFMKPFVSLSFMKDSPLRLFLQRKDIIESFERDLSSIVNFSLPMSSSGYRLTRALKDYTNKINRLGSQANTALRTKDWTARVFIISHWKREISRFYDSVMSLPLPKNLTEEEQKQYTTLLKEQMQVYEKQITQLQNELNSLWSRDFLKDYRESLNQDKVFYGPLKWEMKKLVVVSEGNDRKQILRLLSSLKTEPRTHQVAEREENQIQNFYKILKKNPFDQKSLIELLKMEKKRNNKALSYYLVNRIQELKKKNQRIKL